MLTYITRRLLISLVTLLLITVVVYGIIRYMPGSPLTVAQAAVDPSRRLDPENLKRVEKLWGLHEPVWKAYLIWLGNLARLDMGQSFLFKQPVTRVIGDRIGPTMMLSITSITLTYLLSIPLGLYATARSGHTDERTISVGLYMLYSFPGFVAALLLQLVLAVKLGWLPLFGMTGPDFEQMSMGEKVWDLFQHAVMPVTVYTYAGLAYYSRFVRANMQEVIRQDYIRTARAKGAGPARVLWRHAFRNTLIPLVTLIGLELPALLSGSVIIEQIFAWPGMGNLFFDSIVSRDYPVIMGLTVTFSVLTLLGVLLSDVLYAFVDPRISYS